MDLHRAEELESELLRQRQLLEDMVMRNLDSHFVVLIYLTEFPILLQESALSAERHKSLEWMERHNRERDARWRRIIFRKLFFDGNSMCVIFHFTLDTLLRRRRRSAQGDWKPLPGGQTR